MLNFTSLYSGSSGNCLFVETQNTKILIDAGVSLKKIEKGLDSINVLPSDSTNTEINPSLTLPVLFITKSS